MAKKKRKLNITKTNLLVDITVFSGFLIALNPDATGMTIHEWISLALAGGLLTHLLMHWKWIVATSKRLFKHTSMQARINYVLNALFFIAVVIIMFTGMMISERAMPALGLRIGGGGIWEGLHEAAAEASIALLGLHVALHWKWIVNAGKRFLLYPIASVFVPKPMPKKELTS